MLRRRLLLVLFALGTNMGIQPIVGTGEAQRKRSALRRVRRTSSPATTSRRDHPLVNATFAARDAAWWGRATACASDWKKFGSWSYNLMTEWHQRYGGPGVMIYWHVERKSAVHLLPAQVLLGVRGRRDDRGRAAALHRRRDRGQYTDTHGASVVGFAFAHLLDFKLLPRLKNIGATALPPAAGQADVAQPGPCSRPADRLGPDRSAVRPDREVHHRPAAAAPPRPSRSCAASPAAGPSTPPTGRSKSWAGRCARSSSATTWPTSSCAGRSTRGCRSSRTGTPPTRTYYGKDGDLTGHDREHAEISMLALHLLQSAWCTSTPCSCRRSWPTRRGPGA